MPEINDLDVETIRRRDVVLEFINRKSTVTKTKEDKIKEENLSTSSKIEETTRTESPVILLTAENIKKVTALTESHNSCSFKPRKPVEIKTGIAITPEKKYDGPLICIVPKKDRTPKAPIKQVRKKTVSLVEKKHHGSRREKGGVIRNFLRTLGNFMK